MKYPFILITFLFVSSIYSQNTTNTAVGGYIKSYSDRTLKISTPNNESELVQYDFDDKSVRINGELTISDFVLTDSIADNSNNVRTLIQSTQQIDTDITTLQATDINDKNQLLDSLSNHNTRINNIQLSYTVDTIYNCFPIWAEESGGANANSAEWSFGNGAAGYMGIPIDTGYYVTKMFFNADTYAATATIQVDLMNYFTSGDAADKTIASISLSSATDGGGTTNHAFKHIEFEDPIPIGNTTNTLLGFVTRTNVGTKSDMRVGAEVCRQEGTYISSITLIK